MQRRLAAILAADVVGYSRMMNADEAATLEMLRALKSQHLHPIFAAQNGHVVKSMGDGWLVEFQSVVDAVTAAMQVQDALAGHPGLALRIGVHIGDITHADDDIYGDGINIAARLEPLAAPGGIAISEPAYSSLDGTLRPSFDDRGEQALKNIERPMRVWARPPAQALRVVPSSEQPSSDTQSGFPQLVIAPFTTSDVRAEIQELAEALTSDIQTYLSQLNWLETRISETREAPAYCLKSVLRARGDRLRLEARLYHPDGTEAWSQKFDGALEDSFDWQDQVAEDIASQLIGLVLDAETRRLGDVDSADLTAEQCLLAGMMTWRSYGPGTYVSALRLHKRAIDANPGLYAAYAEAIIVLISGLTLRYEAELTEFRAELPRWVEAATQYAGLSPALDLSIALARYMDDRDAAAAVQAFTDNLRRAPFDARVLSFSGWSFIWCGRADLGYDCLVKAVRIGRFSPFYIASLGGAAAACVQMNRPSEALEFATRGIEVSPTYATFHSTSAAAYAMLDQMDEARAALARHLELSPGTTISWWKSYNNYGNSEGGERYFAALRKAGLPE